MSAPSAVRRNSFDKRSTSMRACFIIDPIEKLKPKKDSSIDLMIEAASRGYQVDFCLYNDVNAGSEGVSGEVRSIEMSPDIRATYKWDPSLAKIGAARNANFADYDVIFIRKDPPFDDGYFSLTLLLEPLEKKVVFVNSPRGVRTVSEKLSALHFAEFTPPTFASYSVERLRTFAQRFDKVVLKPCYLGSGEGVVVSYAADEKFKDYVEFILDRAPRGPVIAQAFLPEIVDGDTRVMMIDGEPIAALGRKPSEGDFRANIAVGGTEFFVEPTPAQMTIAKTIGGFLRENKIIFAGIDLIGEKLIEINVTSPTLIQELRRVGGPDISKKLWDALEQKVKARA
ncbi:MAG: glutathione synthase [Caulobacterales bacterium]